MSELTDDEWMMDVSTMIAAWFLATAFAASLLLYAGFAL
jgi:hypothetical protein